MRGKFLLCPLIHHILVVVYLILLQVSIRNLNFFGQSECINPNMGNQNPQGLGYNFEFPTADETRISQIMTDAVQRTHEYPVRRTFSGAKNEMRDELFLYFENMAELNSWQPE